VTSEVAPLIKTGGLADVAGSLPAALMQAGVDIRVLVPGYKQVMEGVKSKGRLASFPALGEMPASQLLAGKLPSGVPLLIVDSAPLYDRPGGPYQDTSGNDWPDNAVRFGLLSYIGAVLGSAASPISWRPRIAHANDWQAGLTPAYLHFMPGEKARTVMTVHNLAYQGIFPPTTGSRLGLPPSSFSPNGVEYYGNMSFLKAGLHYADHITTVSPNYAREIQQEPLGMGFQGLLAHRAQTLNGSSMASIPMPGSNDPLHRATTMPRAGKAGEQEACSSAWGWRRTTDPLLETSGGSRIRRLICCSRWRRTWFTLSSPACSTGNGAQNPGRVRCPGARIRAVSGCR
jgi:starch synthase